VRRIVSGLFSSIDGVVQADDDWQFAYFDEELFASITAAWRSADAALIGRRSFEGYRALREEHPDSPMLGFFDGADRYVLSSTIGDPGWPGTEVLADGLDQVEALRQESGGDVLVCGSPSVVRGLLARGLLDELNITLLPIVVGSGDRLFPETVQSGPHRLPLTLAGSRALRSGAVELSYRRTAPA
jgi:dihydrofolate reductase